MAQAGTSEQNRNLRCVKPNTCVRLCSPELRVQCEVLRDCTKTTKEHMKFFDSTPPWGGGSKEVKNGHFEPVFGLIILNFQDERSLVPSWCFQMKPLLLHNE